VYILPQDDKEEDPVPRDIWPKGHRGKWIPLFSSAQDEWETPDDLFKKLDEEFHFTLDVCATKENAKCPAYFSKEINGLKQPWYPHTCFMNPPYGRQIGDWVRKALFSSLRGTTVVCLLPARTDTKWFHDYIYGKAEIRFLKGRVKFSYKGKSGPAPFPSMIVIYYPPGHIRWLGDRPLSVG